MKSKRLTLKPAAARPELERLLKTAGAKDNVQLKDSGARRELPTGSVRDIRDGKGRYDLLPAYAIHLVARQYEEGSKKYGDRNWEKGQPLSWYLDSAMRHIFKHLAGERDERHDVAAAWNMLSFLETQQRIATGQLPSELDDLPKPASDKPQF